jgi:hypothetical protein
MILISIHPFAFKKLFLLIVAFLCVSSALCFADSLFMTRHYAPNQSRPAFGPFRPADIGSALRFVSVAANTEREGRWRASQFSVYGTDDYSTSSRVTDSRWACILNSQQPWVYGRCLAIEPAEESSTPPSPSDRLSLF